MGKIQHAISLCVILAIGYGNGVYHTHIPERYIPAVYLSDKNGRRQNKRIGRADHPFRAQRYTMGTRGAWATAFLQQLGNNNPSDDTVNVVAAWTKVEGTKAQYNPLATSLAYGTFSCFSYHADGSCWIKNYDNYQTGIEASVATLREDHYGYADLKDALLQND